MDRYFANRIYPRVCLRRRASEDLALLHSLLVYGFDSAHLIERSQSWIIIQENPGYDIIGLLCVPTMYGINQRCLYM